MLKDANSMPKMKSVFYDFELLSKGLVKGYYLLSVEIIGLYEIEERSIISKELKSSIHELLNKQQKAYITERYGLNGAKIQTLEEIGQKHNVTRERVRQVLDEAHKILRASKKNFYVPTRIKYLTIKKQEIEKELEHYTNQKNRQPVEITIHDFPFSTRAFNVLFNNDIITYKQLMSLTPSKLIKMKNMGLKTVDEIWFILHGHHIDILD